MRSVLTQTGRAARARATVAVPDWVMVPGPPASTVVWTASAAVFGARLTMVVRMIRVGVPPVGVNVMRSVSLSARRCSAVRVFAFSAQAIWIAPGAMTARDAARQARVTRLRPGTRHDTV